MGGGGGGAVVAQTLSERSLPKNPAGGVGSSGSERGGAPCRRALIGASLATPPPAISLNVPGNVGVKGADEKMLSCDAIANARTRSLVPSVSSCF